MRKTTIRAVEGFMRWRLKGRLVALSCRNDIQWTGTIMSVKLDEDTGSVIITAFHETDGVVPLETGCGHAPVVRFPLSGKLMWRSSGGYYEVVTDGMDTRRGFDVPTTLGSRAYRPGDRQAFAEEPEHYQGPAQAPWSPTAPNGRAFGEGPGWLPPRYHDPHAPEGEADGADDPSEDSDAGGEGPSGTLTVTLAVYDNGKLPDGVLIAVSPEQEIDIYRLDEPPPPMCDGTVVYANKFTANQYAAWTRRLHGNPENN